MPFDSAAQSSIRDILSFQTDIAQLIQQLLKRREETEKRRQEEERAFREQKEQEGYDWTFSSEENTNQVSEYLAAQGAMMQVDKFGTVELDSDPPRSVYEADDFRISKTTVEDQVTYEVQSRANPDHKLVAVGGPDGPLVTENTLPFASFQELLEARGRMELFGDREVDSAKDHLERSGGLAPLGARAIAVCQQTLDLVGANRYDATSEPYRLERDEDGKNARIIHRESGRVVAYDMEPGGELFVNMTPEDVGVINGFQQKLVEAQRAQEQQPQHNQSPRRGPGRPPGSKSRNSAPGRSKGHERGAERER